MMSTRTFASRGEALALHSIGVRFRDLPAAHRDLLALDPAGVGEALAAVSHLLPGAEAVVLATCNRTELYVVTADDPDRLDLWHRSVGHRLGDDRCPATLGARSHRSGTEAAEHLLRVAAGLESDEIGDVEIGAQVQRAREQAVDAGTVGPVLHRLFDLAATVGKRTRTETDISRGGAGVGLATATTVLDAVAQGAVAPEPHVVVLGAGEAGAAVCRDLDKRLPVRLTICNRTRARAEEVAARHHGATAAGLDDLGAVLAGADVVVTALHAPSPVLDDELVAAVRALRPGWAPLVVDTCVPRMVDAGVDVVHLADAPARRRALAEQREASVPAAEAIVAEAVDGFGRWYRDRALDDVVAALFREAEELTAVAADLVGDERTARELHRAVRRLVHAHITRLRAIDEPVDGRSRKDTNR